MDIERKCDFNSITDEEIITYKFEATIKDKKPCDKFIKSPLKIEMVLETIEQDNHNHKDGDKKPRYKKPRKDSQTVHQKMNRSDTPTKHDNQSQFCPTRKKSQTGICASAANKIRHWNTYVRHGEHNGRIAKRWDILPRCANPRGSTG